MPVLCDIINTGSELTLGRTLNRHAAWLGQRLQQDGVVVRRALTLPDEPILCAELAVSLAAADVVLVTGGLGPTVDDRTREYVAEMFGAELLRDAGVEQSILERFAARGRNCGTEQLRQAMVPRGARVLVNAAGTAPGLAWTGGGLPGDCRARLLCLLPGPPRELQPMYDGQVRPLLGEVFSTGLQRPALREFHFAGIGEGALAARLAPVLEVDGVETGYCAHADGTVELRLIGAERVLDEIARAVRALGGSDLFADGADSLEACVVRRLRECGAMLALAESCTGGAVAGRITDVPGASGVFGFGFVTYANEAKSRMLGVPEEVVAAHGAVSEAVAMAMAQGALVAAGADYALALTGIAGPGGGTKEKPVGTLCLGLARRGRPAQARTVRLPGGRAEFKLHAGTLALDWLRREM